MRGISLLTFIACLENGNFKFLKLNLNNNESLNSLFSENKFDAVCNLPPLILIYLCQIKFSPGVSIQSNKLAKLLAK